MKKKISLTHLQVHNKIANANNLPKTNFEMSLQKKKMLTGSDQWCVVVFSEDPN